MQDNPSDETFQDYLKIILCINKGKKSRNDLISNKEIATLLGVKPPSVTGIITKLEKAGLVVWKKREGVRLTTAGYVIASKVLKMYDVVTSYFTSVLKIEDQDIKHRIACKIEHVMCDEPDFAKILENYIFSTNKKKGQLDHRNMNTSCKDEVYG